MQTKRLLNFGNGVIYMHVIFGVLLADGQTAKFFNIF